MTAAMTERLVAVARAARCAGHGNRGAIYNAASIELGISRATLLRKLKEVAVTDKRKQRADAGRTALTRDEAAIISATLMEATHKNGKRLYSVADAVETLRANNMITAGRMDEETGEWWPLSESTIIRALRGYGLHPDQLSQPAPVTELASLHPNHVWEIDASLCTLYYLSNGTKGLQVMNSAEFYKNKPKNLQRIAAERVWSYEVTDHTSGWIYVEYVLGAESGENLCSVLMNAMQERGGADVFHGVPKMLYLDPGSANTASMTKNLCRSLGIDVVPHKPHNARATGQVEKARDIIECKFEPGLKFQPVHMLYHWLFSFAFALVYVLASAYWPKVRLWYGAAYGLIITIAMHGFLIPALGFRHPAYLNGETGWLWNLNGYELWSEILGHICWSFSIEISMIAVLALLAKPIQGAWANRP